MGTGIGTHCTQRITYISFSSWRIHLYSISFCIWGLRSWINVTVCSDLGPGSPAIWSTFVTCFSPVTRRALVEDRDLQWFSCFLGCFFTWMSTHVSCDIHWPFTRVTQSVCLSISVLAFRSAHPPSSPEMYFVVLCGIQFVRVLFS